MCQVPKITVPLGSASSKPNRLGVRCSLRIFAHSIDSCASCSGSVTSEDALSPGKSTVAHDRAASSFLIASMLSSGTGRTRLWAYSTMFRHVSQHHEYQGNMHSPQHARKKSIIFLWMMLSPHAALNTGRIGYPSSYVMPSSRPIRGLAVFGRLRKQCHCQY